MNIYPQVERWRGTVQSAINNLFANEPQTMNAIKAINLPVETLSNIILAIIQHESSGNEKAIGDGGNSRGLMQLNYGAGTPQGMGYKGTIEGLSDGYTNIYYGTKYFLNRLAKYKNIDDAIIAYGRGSLVKSQAMLDYVAYVKEFVKSVQTLTVQNKTKSGAVLLFAALGIGVIIYALKKKRR